MGRTLWLSILIIAIGGCQQSESIDKKRYEAGRELFQFACQGCHVANRPRNDIGPHLHNLVGRRAARADGFIYSSALQDSKIVWTEDAIDAFIADPLGYLPGTKMGVAGIADQEERDLLVYYLSRVTEQ